MAANLGLSETGLNLVSGSELYALIGMPAMLAAYIKAPLTSVLLLFEVPTTNTKTTNATQYARQNARNTRKNYRKPPRTPHRSS